MKTMKKKTCKGVKRRVLQNKITHEDYLRALNGYDINDIIQLVNFNVIRSVKQNLGSYNITKIGLCPLDDKRYILENGKDTLALGHYKTLI